MCSDSEKNMSAFADQNHAPSLTCVRLECMGEFNMNERTDIFNINFYKKERFHGSYKGMHYRIEKYEPEEGDTVLRVTVWPGPYNFDTTPDEQKNCASYPFTEDGLTQVCDHLNEFYAAHFCN